MKATVTDVHKRITTKPDKQSGILGYDIDNSYPQRVQDIINSSGTGTLCTNIFGKFVYGQGFINEALAKTVINRKRLTANKLLFKSGKAISKYNGFAIHVNYDANFKKTSFSYIPFQDVRFTTSDHKQHPEMIAVYDDWQKVKKAKIDEADVDYFNYYNPDPKVIQEEVDACGGWHNYKGQIMYWSIDGVEYPLAPSDSVLEDIQTDAHAKAFKFRNITTNFMASHFLKVQTFESEEQKQEFVNTLVSFQGADDASKIMVVEQDNEEELFELEKVDIQDIGDLYAFTEESARNNIIRAYLIPPVLLLAVAGKLGSSTEIIDATAFYNGVTDDYRTEVTAVFSELFNDSIFVVGDDFDIKEVEAETAKAKNTPEGKKAIIEIVDSSTLSDKEKRAVLLNVYGLTNEDVQSLVPMAIAPEGVEVVEEVIDEGAKAKATLRGSVGGVTSILTIQTAVTNGSTSYESGLAILEIIFGLSNNDAKRVLGTEQQLNQ